MNHDETSRHAHAGPSLTEFPRARFDDEAVEAAARVLLRQYASDYSADHLNWEDFADSAREVLEAVTPYLTSSEPPDQEAAIARAITSSVRGTSWAALTPLAIARHLVANGVRIS